MNVLKQCCLAHLLIFILTLCKITSDLTNISKRCSSHTSHFGRSFSACAGPLDKSERTAYISIQWRVHLCMVRRHEHCISLTVYVLETVHASVRSNMHQRHSKSQYGLLRTSRGLNLLRDSTESTKGKCRESVSCLDCITL